MRRRNRFLPGLAAALAFLCLAFLCLAAGGTAAADDLYRARTIVTGTGAENRPEGFARCFADVMVKASGDPRLAGDPRVAALAENAADYVSGYAYRDRMEGIPVHDEQGSRDRPHILTVDFDPRLIGDALRSLDHKVWPAPRPVLALDIDVRLGGADFVLGTDEARGRDMRDALTVAAERFGLTVELPGATPGGEAPGGRVPLEGSLVWNPEALGWVAEWRLDASGRSYRWTIDGVGFDAAFRNAIGGAAQILSGNGTPG